ncbi:MAG TPA: hypothetical protein VNK89_01540, partial [Thermoflexus sp.]|nr:hypothetical protein [Thermoflexus sp.]
MGRARPLLESALAILIGLVAGGLLMLPFRYDPLKAYQALFRGAFGTAHDILETLAFATPLMLTALTFALGVRAGLFNIGAEGQMYVGAISAVFVASLLPLPPGLHIAVATLAGMIGGALWSLVPALLKIWRGVHEVISTIMLNFIAVGVGQYLFSTYLQAPRGPQDLIIKTREIPPSGRFPSLNR